MGPHGHRLRDLAAATGGTLSGDGEARVEHLVVDTRKPVPQDGALFVALKGPHHDGHAYLEAMYQRGVRHFLVGTGTTVPAGCNAIHVNDTWDALHRMAAWHRGHHHARVVGITGSNGKTVVKEWLFQMLHDQERIVRSPGSWNSRLGVPLSVWELAPEHTLALFEAGISKPGEMDALRAIIRPDIGIFTNIGPAHARDFANDREKALEKVKLFRDVRAIVYCRDHAVVREAIGAGLDRSCVHLDWSREQSAFVHLVNEQRTSSGIALRLLHDHRDFTVQLPFDDAASVENALHSITLLLHLGHDPEWIAARVQRLQPVAMRLRTLDGVHGSTLIDDSYSNDLASLGIALDHLDALAQDRPRVVVLSDILGSGLQPADLHGRVATLLQRARVHRLIAVGPQLAGSKGLFPANTIHVANAAAVVHALDAHDLANAVVLVKGARDFALERVVEHWQEKTHGTVLEIDLEAVRHNLDHYREALGTAGAGGGRVRIMAMVKAFGYGGGALELARLFAHANVDHLGVAYADEGIDLRQNGIRTPIMVMNPEPVPLELLRRFDLEPVVYHAASLQAALAFARTHPDAPPVHLKLDTGMHRLGFTETELPDALERLRHAQGLTVGSLFSHLAASEEPAHDGFTRAQIERFTRMAGAVLGVLDHRPLLHLANSAGATRWPEARFDMVRLGIGLHGIGADERETAVLRPAAALRTPIAQIKFVAPGDSIGYGRTYTAERPQRIAILPIGYADGLSRRLGNGRGRVWIRDHAAPFVGTICMDMCMVDVTAIDCREGDDAFLFDQKHTVSEFAHDLGTIPYEALTSISQRVKRVYTRS